MKNEVKMKPAVQRPSKPRSVYWLKWLVPRETVHFVSRDSRGIKFLPRDQSLRNLLYSWKFIKPRCKGGRRSTVAGNSVLLPLDFAALRAQRFLRETVSFEGRSSQLYTQLMQLRNESRKKVRACTGFELLTSAIRVQRSTNWANKPTGSRSLNWFVINPWKDDDEIMNIWKSYMWTTEWRIIWRKIKQFHC